MPDMTKGRNILCRDTDKLSIKTKYHPEWKIVLIININFKPSII